MAAQRFAQKNAADSDPLLGLINLFDASMVLVVAMLLALVGKGSMAEIAARLSQQDVTIVTNPGRPDMEMIIKRGKKIEKLKATGEQGRGAGRKLGTAYRLESGEVVYVPEAGGAEP
ncbi:MAG: DUF2149 domain-containing protein [Bryobacteraceae bacterium]|nr:DUF2149 domain-containing protein [Bryobacteraceae bacterium]MDW8376870.1 DUF2149 domain-containing protein [Bryobacterales bacterium]